MKLDSFREVSSYLARASSRLSDARVGTVPSRARNSKRNLNTWRASVADGARSLSHRFLGIPAFSVDDCRPGTDKPEFSRELLQFPEGVKEKYTVLFFLADS